MGLQANGTAAEILDREWRGRAHVQHGAEAGRDRDVHQVRAQLCGRDSGTGLFVGAMVDRLVPGSVRIDLGDVNARKLLAEERLRYAPAKRAICQRRKRHYANRETSGSYAAK